MPRATIIQKPSDLLHTRSSQQWQKIGIDKRAGIAVPLSSIHTRKSMGIGEFPDLELLIDWCRKVGLSIIQLLPLNDMGFDFTPYNAQSTKALDPIYLSLDKLAHVDCKPFRKNIAKSRKWYALSPETLYFDKGIKGAKLELLWRIFSSKKWSKLKGFSAFQHGNQGWLVDYARFKVLKEQYQQKAWFDWPEPLKMRDAKAMAEFDNQESLRLEFQKWLQWQCFEQMRSAKRHADKQGILLMGDLPFLVARDSADVWTHQNYFKLDLGSGAPPDVYFADGQSWGMPPYNWAAIAGDGYKYLVSKLQFAEHFYHMFRVDHFVGLFRVWTLPYGTAEKARQGAFDPPEEHLWKAHSLNILAPVLNSTSMLCCAEDLGTVPDCSYEVIDECGIVGMDVIRWQREWENRSEFLRPEQYRINSIAVHATHDMSDLRTWWEYEAGTVDALGIKNQLQNRGFDLDSLLAGLFEKKQPLPGRLRWRKEITDESSLLEKLQRPADQVADILKVFRESAFEKKLFLEWLGVKNAKNLSKARLYPRMLQKSLECRSVFIIHLLQDWLAWSPWLSDMDPRPLRINLPGTIHDNNWRLVMPFFLEDLFKDQDVLATMRSILSVPGEMA